MENKNVKNENAISRSVRAERPGNYLFQIESFSLLLNAFTKTNCDKFESPHFDAGGHKWKLSVYPNGDKKRGGDGYLSLYLALADPKFLYQGDDILVIVEFFIYDYLRDNYLVLQDGKENRFHMLNTECGVSKLLALDTFNDPAKGYLVDDSCMFGVEIFIHTIDRRGDVSLSKKSVSAGESRFSWKIDKFSTLSKMQESSVFTTVGGTEWNLCLYPKGNSPEKDTYMSLFLGVHNPSSLLLGWTFYAQYKLTIMDQLNQKHHEMTVEDKWFSADSMWWGFSMFIRLSDLKDVSRGFIVNDTVVIELKFMYISVTKTP